MSLAADFSALDSANAHSLMQLSHQSLGIWLNMFAPTRTLLHTYNRHDHHHHDHHYHHHNHHLYLHKGSKIATPYEQYVDWRKNINFIFMRGQNLPPPMNNMLTGVTTSTLSSWGIKTRHPLWTICWLGNDINFIFMRDQNLPPPMNNMLVGVTTSTLLHEGSTFATPFEQFVDWRNNINFIFMRDQHSPPPINNMLVGVTTSTLSFMRDQNLPPPMNNMLTGVTTSTLSSWGIAIRHPPWTICWLG